MASAPFGKEGGGPGRGSEKEPADLIKAVFAWSHLVTAKEGSCTDAFRCFSLSCLCEERQRRRNPEPHTLSILPWIAARPLAARDDDLHHPYESARWEAEWAATDAASIGQSR